MMVRWREKEKVLHIFYSRISAKTDEDEEEEKGIWPKKNEACCKQEKNEKAKP